MGFLDTVVIPGSTASKSSANVPASKSPKTGFLASVSIPSVKEQAKAAVTDKLTVDIEKQKREAAYLNSPTGLAINTLKGVGDTVSNFGKGLFDMFAHPSAEQQQFEEKYQITLPDNAPTAQKVLTAPGRWTAMALTRFINPGLQPVATDLAEIIAISEPGGIADQVQAGKIPASVLDEFAVLKKTNPQIVGDVAQAVLTAYGGGAGTNIASKGLVREGAVQGAKLGALFGGAGAASSGETDPLKIAESVGLGALGGGVLGGITSGVIPVSKKLREAVMPSKAAYDLFVEQAANAPKGSAFMDSVKLPVKHLPSDYNAGGLYEPYAPNSRLPVIETGPGAPRGDLPTIDLDTGRTTKGRTAPAEPLRAQEPAIPLQVPPVGRVKEVKPVGGGEARLSRLAASLDARATEEGLARLADLPEYQTMNIEEQAVLANHLIETNANIALQVAKGERLPPAGLHPEAVFTALENAALKAGDVQILRELASGNLSTQATGMGQRIRLLGERNPESPVKIIRDVQESRQANIEKNEGVSFEKAKEKQVEAIKTEIKKAAPKKETWEGFIKSLECGY